jgi:hypothetical protein
MFRRPALTLGLCAALAAPGSAMGDTTIATDTHADQVTALDGTVVWVSGEFGSQVLMRRTSTGAERVPGTPAAQAYRTVDLGRDRSGNLVLTYRRCATTTACVAYRDDLAGTRRRIKAPAVSRCLPTTAPALWRDRSATGMSCTTAGGRHDAKRSGIYVRTGTGTPRRIALPRDAERHGATMIEAVDLRGTRVAGIAADIYEYAFSADVSGRAPRHFLAAASEGESSASASGVVLGTGGTVWSLVTAEHTGDPNQAIVYRQAGACLDYERLPNSGPEVQGFRATDVAVDGRTVYLAVPGTGIVRHDYVAEKPCA